MGRHAAINAESATPAMSAAHPTSDASGSRSALRPAGSGSRLTACIVRATNPADGAGRSTA